MFLCLNCSAKLQDEDLDTKVIYHGGWTEAPGTERVLCCPNCGDTQFDEVVECSECGDLILKSDDDEYTTLDVTVKSFKGNEYYSDIICKNCAFEFLRREFGV